jgi:SAM-dependent methyltransferase
MDDPFFERFFPDEPVSILAYLSAIRAYLPPRGRLLDLGCGANRQLARLRRHRYEVWGADFQEHPELADRDWFRFLADDGRIPFPDRSFDVVACCWVLEHVDRPAEFLGEVRRVLRPGGRLVALSINGAHYVTGIARLLRLAPHALTQRLVQRLYERPAHDTFPTCYRLNTRRQLERTAAAAGLRLEQLDYFANPDYFSFFEPLRRLAIRADWALERLRPGLGRVYFVSVLRRPIRSQPASPARWSPARIVAAPVHVSSTSAPQ